MISKKNECCRYCGSTRLTKIISLGNHPPSNSFIPASQIMSEEYFPLDVYFCEGCNLTQLLDVVSAEFIFDEYLYLSSSSKALKNHYRELAHFLTDRFKLQPGDLVIDIGCNDGVLLHGYPQRKLSRLGVEPSKVSEVASASGLDVVRDFFSSQTARKIVEKHGMAKIVTATNVFAHVDNIDEFVRGLPMLLGEDGVLVIEAPYLMDLIDQVLFDTIYHEHLCYLCLTPMIPLLERHGLEVFDLERVPFGASGPAFRVYVQNQVGGHSIEKSVAATLEGEANWGVGRIGRYMEFAKRVENFRVALLELISSLLSSGARLGGYGAPAKGNTLLNYVGITSEIVECIAETNSLKQGLLTPGSHIPIVSEEEFLARMPQYALLLSWNYLDFFVKNSEYIRKGGRFVVPLPEPRITP